MSAAILYVVAVLSANLTATLFLPVEIVPGTGVLVSVGTLIFGLTFTQRDRMHRRGKPFVYRVIFLAAILNMVLLLSFSYLWGKPLAEAFSRQGWEWLADSAYMLADSGWRVFLASFLAMIIAESADTEVFDYLREKSWIARVLRSNAVSIPVDSIVFNLVAFAGSAFFPFWILVQVIIGEIISKYLVGALYALVSPKAHRSERPREGASS